MTSDPERSAAVVLRSILFHIASGLLVLAILPLYLFAWVPIWLVWSALAIFIRIELLLLRWICGLDYAVSGLENLPDGPCILACRHEAVWETLVLPYVFGNPVIYLKEEILRYPVVGRLVRRLRHVPVRRAPDIATMRRDFDRVKDEARSGRSVLIFPSGTRNPRDRYLVQSGVAVLYRSLDLPCVPIVLDSGTYWPHRSWLRKPGTIHVKVLPPISPGHSSKTFLDELGKAMRVPAT